MGCFARNSRCLVLPAAHLSLTQCFEISALTLCHCMQWVDTHIYCDAYCTSCDVLPPKRGVTQRTNRWTGLPLGNLSGHLRVSLSHPASHPGTETHDDAAATILQLMLLPAQLTERHTSQWPPGQLAHCSTCSTGAQCLRHAQPFSRQTGSQQCDSHAASVMHTHSDTNADSLLGHTVSLA